MTLSAMIAGTAVSQSATVTLATLATVKPIPQPSVATVATVTVATPQPEAPEPPADPVALDIGSGCTERLAMDAWHREWRRVADDWQGRAWELPAEGVLRLQVAELVAKWNACTGQRRAPAEVFQHLSAVDYTDNQLMRPGTLALYVWTCLRDPAP